MGIKLPEGIVMKKILALIVSLVLCFSVSSVLFGCGNSVQDGVIDYKTKTITVAYTDYEPMNYTEDGVLKGFDTELALMTFNALGYDVRFKLIDWSNKYNELSAGTVDCLWNGFTANSSDDGTPRNQIVNFSYFYMQNKQCIVKKSGSQTINALSDFAGKTVSYEASSAGEDFLAEANDLRKKPVTSQMDALKEVNSGTSQYAVVDLLLASRICGKGNFSSLELNEGLASEVEYYAIGFAKTEAGAKLRDDVNVMLTAFSKTGTLKALAEKYGLEKAYVDLSNPTPNVY